MATTEIKPEGIRQAAEVMQAFLRARKNLRLYPPNNPIYAKTVKDAHEKLMAFFEHGDSLDLRITRNEILLGADTVFQSAGKDENLALFFFRDGLRDLSFKREIDESEFQGFLEVMSVDFDREEVEDDLVTLLWAREFQNIKYTVDDTFLVEDEQYKEEASAHAKEDACSADNLRAAYEEATRSDERHEIAFMPITDSDMKAIVSMVEKDRESKNRKLINILIDMLLQSRDSDELKDIALIMNNAVDYFVQGRDLKSAVEVIKKAKIFMDEAPTAEVKKHLNLVIAHASSPGLIAGVGDVIDSAERLDEQMYEEFLVLLGASAIGPFISLLGEVKTVSGKKRVMTALERLGRHDVATLAKGLRDDRPHVVRAIVQIIRSIGDRKATDYLVKSARHEDAGVRKDLLLTLGELAGPGAPETIKDFLDDPSETVRMAAAKALAQTGSEYARRTLLGWATEKRLLKMSFEEMKNLFEALAKLGGKDITESTMKMAKKTAIFNRSKFGELKACAVYCLGLMRSQEAEGLVRGLVGSGNKLVGEYAAAAIKRIEHGK